MAALPVRVLFLLVTSVAFSCSFLEAQEPAFRSDVINARTDGHQVAIEVDITGAEDLYLVADDVDGFSFDWCD
ncbi:MAG: hypothetical protein AAF456_06300, partial [Planctomycetota bacterium]